MFLGNVGSSSSKSLRAYNDVVDWNVDQLNEEADKSHDCEADCCCHGNFLKLFPVWFRAALDKSYRVFSELFRWVDVRHNLIHLYF